MVTRLEVTISDSDRGTLVKERAGRKSLETVRARNQDSISTIGLDRVQQETSAVEKRVLPDDMATAKARTKSGK